MKYKCGLFLLLSPWQYFFLPEFLNGQMWVVPGFVFRWSVMVKLVLTVCQLAAAALRNTVAIAKVRTSFEMLKAEMQALHYFPVRSSRFNKQGLLPRQISSGHLSGLVRQRCLCPRCRQLAVIGSCRVNIGSPSVNS
jgi:hypothetical protein